MRLSLLMKFRIAVAAAVGIVLIGILAWPLAEPSEPFAAVSLFSGAINLTDAIILAALAFSAGLLAYFLAWPWGNEIGILAVPAGLAIWAVRSGSMANAMQQTRAFDQRQALFAVLKWEPFFWLAIVAVGFAGVLVGRIIRQTRNERRKTIDVTRDTRDKKQETISVIISLVGSVFIAQFCIRIFAQDVSSFDNRFGLSIVTGPAVGQIFFAVMVSFAIAAFIVKKFLNVSYIWPIVATALVTAFAVFTYAGQDVLQDLYKRWPGVFFSHSVIAILPIQIVAFGTLGSIAGYWLAVRYDYWRHHELKIAAETAQLPGFNASF